jgi:hypothetical protein
MGKKATQKNKRRESYKKIAWGWKSLWYPQSYSKLLWVRFHEDRHIINQDLKPIEYLFKYMPR